VPHKASDPTAAFLPGIDERMRSLLDHPGAEYEAGIGMMGYTVTYLTAEESAGSVYVIWGSLTDWIDGPRADEPGVYERAITDMRRAARQWLDLRQAGEALEPYLDRWVHDECGYGRDQQ
jgi:hypothetical protein